MRKKLKIAGAVVGIFLALYVGGNAAALQFGSVDNHTLRSVASTEMPPSGGVHALVWQKCGFYDSPVPIERAVHSLEHGAVWITYHPDLPADQVEVLRNLARTEPHTLVSPYPALPSPIVATVWRHQISYEAADATQLAAFVHDFRNGPQAPERNGPCDGPNLYFTGSAGSPER
jgi:hypothetical protein